MTLFRLTLIIYFLCFVTITNAQKTTNKGDATTKSKLFLVDTISVLSFVNDLPSDPDCFCDNYESFSCSIANDTLKVRYYNEDNMGSSYLATVSLQLLESVQLIKIEKDPNLKEKQEFVSELKLTFKGKDVKRNFSYSDEESVYHKEVIILVSLNKIKIAKKIREVLEKTYTTI